MNARRPLAWALASWALSAACTHPESSTPIGAETADVRATFPPTLDAATPTPERDSAPVGATPTNEIDPRFLQADLVGARSIGHTSVVLKLKLTGGLEAAFKPRSVIGKRRYRGEVAAYRLARALGLPNVPPALLRRIPRGPLASLLDSAHADSLVPEVDGAVEGAIIPWIHGLSFLTLEQGPARTAWERGLKGTPSTTDAGSVPEARLAAISTMIVFDFITGNWDRWSGGNIGFANGTLLFIDNDGSFYETPPSAALARQRDLLQGIARFSSSFVEALRGIDLRAALGEDLEGRPLLPEKALASAEDRRRAALAVIDRDIAAKGEAFTLTFP